MNFSILISLVVLALGGGGLGYYLMGERRLRKDGEKEENRPPPDSVESPNPFNDSTFTITPGVEESAAEESKGDLHSLESAPPWGWVDKATIPTTPPKKMPTKKKISKKKASKKKARQKPAKSPK